MSDLDAFEAMAMEAVDDIYAERFRHSPMSAGKADPARPQVEVRAVLRSGGGKFSNGTVNLGRTFRTMIAGEKAELYINPRLYPGLIVRQGDKLRSLERTGSPVWEVAAVEDRAETRLIFQLNQA